ncbi:MAG: hypothetical protein WAV15_04590 [Minisyncoccia bacterium]
MTTLLVVTYLWRKFGRRLVLKWRSWKLAWHGVRVLERKRAVQRYPCNQEKREFWAAKLEEAEAEFDEYLAELGRIYDEQSRSASQ